MPIPPSPLASSLTANQSHIKALWVHIQPRRRIQLWGLLILMVLASFAEVLSIGAVLPFLGVLTAPEMVFKQPFLVPFINFLNIDSPSGLLWPLTAVFILAALFSGLMRLVLLWAQFRLTSLIGTDLSSDVFRRTLYQPYSVHVGRNSSEVIAAISAKITMVINFFLLPVLMLISAFFLIVAILITLLYIDPTVAISAMVGFGAIYGVVIILTKKKIANNSSKISQQSNQVVKVLQEGLGGIRDILIDSTQNTYSDIYRQADLSLRRAQANVNILASGPRSIIEALGMVLIALIAYVMVVRDQGISGAIPILGALALGAQRLLPVLQQAYYNFITIRGNHETLSDVIALLDQPLPDDINAPAPQPMSFSSDITLNDLSFQYGAQGVQGPKVLKDLHITISKGSRVGFIGTTGSGKSTLIDVVMSLLPPSQGTLEIDGVAITKINRRAWQAHIAHVPQSIFLADSSIAENIAFGIPLDQIDKPRLKLAAQQAQIAGTIEAWPEQYMTFVGERGVRLSGGQRQRIGIARALYKQANVIVFDEATSALDNETERAVMQAIEGLGSELTLLIVAHRLSTLKHCTQIIELTHGKITRQGSYADIVGDESHI